MGLSHLRTNKRNLVRMMQSEIIPTKPLSLFVGPSEAWNCLKTSLQILRNLGRDRVALADTPLNSYLFLSALLGSLLSGPDKGSRSFTSLIYRLNHIASGVLNHAWSKIDRVLDFSQTFHGFTFKYRVAYPIDLI